MAIVQYKYVKILDKVMTAAIVQLEIVENNLKIDRVFVETEKIPFRSQGMIEGGHKNWNISAKKALEIAVVSIDKLYKLDITIKKLEGRIFLDTNNASIGVACILALLQYLEIQTENKMMEKIHQFVKEDWKNEVDVIPDYTLIFEN